MLCDVDYNISKLTTELQVLKSFLDVCTSDVHTCGCFENHSKLILFFLSFSVILFTINVVLMHSLCIKVVLILITKRS